MDAAAGDGVGEAPVLHGLGADRFLTAGFEQVADAVREVALGRDPGDGRRAELVALGLAKVTPRSLFDSQMFSVSLTERGDAFDEAWGVYGDRAAAEAIIRDGFLALPQTQALVQGLHGRQPVKVEGALHLLARHRLGDSSQVTEFRAYLQRLNDLGVVAYSKKAQSVRVVADVPGPEEPQPTLRVIERERPYSNLLALRRTLRACTGHIWWADVHFSRKGLEPLVDEADATRVKEIRILSGSAQIGDKTPDDFARFKKEMAALGITADWRVIEDRADLDFHDRFIVTNRKAWNVPPVNTLFKGDYSEITLTTAPPFESWWKKGKPLGVTRLVAHSTVRRTGAMVTISNEVRKGDNGDLQPWVHLGDLLDFPLTQ